MDVTGTLGHALVQLKQVTYISCSGLKPMDVIGTLGHAGVQL